MTLKSFLLAIFLPLNFTVGFTSFSIITTPSFVGASSDLQSCSDACRYGADHCIGSKCIYGCEPGWTGRQCNKPCYIHHCLECKVDPSDSNLRYCTRCEPGYYGDSCENVCSENCLFGFQHCSREGNCTYGCKPNWQGYKCITQHCDIPKCKLCRTIYGNHYCHICNDGMYWNQHDRCINCTGNCIGGSSTCNTTTGICPNGCEKGWYGSSCNLQCTISNCLKCEAQGYLQKATCVICKDGFYKSNRACVACSTNCISGNQTQTCDPDNGQCHNGCSLGWYGRKCTRKCLILNCKVCGEDYYGVPHCDQCEKGWYWNSSNSSCVRCTGNCLGGSEECNGSSGLCLYGCAKGYYGYYCDNPCRSECVNGSCNPKSGECDFGCVHGWYGPHCDRRCPINCRSCSEFVNNTCGDCESGTYGVICEKKCSEHCERSPFNGYLYCKKDTGRCDHGCVGGYYGDMCNLSCSSNCYTRVCNQNTGNCNAGCTNVWYGKKCDQRCPENCGSPASEDLLHCNQMTGDCVHGCKTGYFGDKCESSCSDKCKNGVCNKNSGMCEEGCQNGYHGLNCTRNCSAKCDDNICNQITGRCENCKPGFFGEYCGYECVDYCYSECNRNTGFCDSCKNGFYGGNCERKCLNCFNDTCDQYTGQCSHGCDEGMTGFECKQKCSSGWFGRSCQYTCGQCKDSTPCHWKSGECQLGCDVGWTGPTCRDYVQAARELKSEDKGVNSDAAIGGSVTALLVAIIVIFIIFLIFRRKNMLHFCHIKKNAKKNSNGQQLGQELQTFTPTEVQSSETVNNAEPLSCNKDWQVSQSDLQILFPVSTNGQFCKIANGKLKSDHCNVSVMIKIYQRDRGKDLKRHFFREVDILKSLPNHPNITNFLGISETADTYSTIFGNDTNYDLLTYLHNLRGSSAELPSAILQNCLKEILQLANGVAEGLSFLHEFQIIHRCIAATNVFLDHHFTAKIGNFYYAAVCDNRCEVYEKSGEEIDKDFTAWMAPEYLKNNIMSYECDVWSFGVMMWEMITLGDKPYERDDIETIISKIIHGERLPKPENCDRRVFRVISRCWFDFPSQRPSSKQMASDINRLLMRVETMDEINNITVTTIV